MAGRLIPIHSKRRFPQWLGAPLLLVAAACTLLPPGTAPDDSTETAAAVLRERIESARSAAGLRVDNRRLSTPKAVAAFYRRRDFQPAWTGDRAADDCLESLLVAIRRADTEALSPDDYHMNRLETLRPDRSNENALPSTNSPQVRADLDLLATDAFITYARDLLYGRVAPESLGPEFRSGVKTTDLPGALQAAIAGRQITAVLDTFRPLHAGYRNLKAAYGRYLDVRASGGWPAVGDGPVLSPGSRDRRSIRLRRRLRAEGYRIPDPPPGEEDIYDDPLRHAVEAFQRCNGLMIDGRFGPVTRDVLNISVEARIGQIGVNLERWRWLPPDLGRRHIRVNIAGFELEAVESGTRVLSMRAVVGKDYRRTPLFSAAMTQVVFNPYWYVPKTVFAEDLLPLIRQNPEYLRQHDYRVLRGWGAEAETLDPDGIDWNAVDPADTEIVLRKAPGPNNPLGRVKFLFPNSFDVYIHDSPDRDIFRQPRRAFSSGCIRIEKPLELAQYILQRETSWNRARIEAVVATAEEQVVDLSAPVPVHIQYWTAWAETDGSVHFREDVYGRDQELLKAIRERRTSE
jgi:murein L,D-transpeptidase YcbB/YkuD